MGLGELEPRSDSNGATLRTKWTDLCLLAVADPRPHPPLLPPDFSPTRTAPPGCHGPAPHSRVSEFVLYFSAGSATRTTPDNRRQPFCDSSPGCESADYRWWLGARGRGPGLFVLQQNRILSILLRDQRRAAGWAKCDEVPPDRPDRPVGGGEVARGIQVPGPRRRVPGGPLPAVPGDARRADAPGRASRPPRGCGGRPPSTGTRCCPPRTEEREVRHLHATRPADGRGGRADRRRTRRPPRSRRKGANDAGEQTVATQFALHGYGLASRGPAGAAADARLLEHWKTRWALLTGELRGR